MTAIPGLGEIPDRWASERARWLLQRQRRDVRPEDGIVTAFRDGQVTLRERRRIEGFTNAIQEIGYHGIRVGDLVVHGMDGFAGAIGVSDSDGKSSPVVHAYRSNEKTDCRYIAYALRTMAVNGYVSTLAKGIRERSTAFDAPTLADVLLPVPPLEEQRRIADFLDGETARIDNLVNARASQIRCLEQLWDARLAEKADELIATYGLLPLRRVVSSVEQGWSPQCEDVEASPAEWAVLKTSAVSSGLFKPLEHKRLPSDLKPDRRYQIADGDILMTRGSGSPAHVGVASVAKVDGRKLLLSDLLYRVRLDCGWSPEFVTLLLGSRPVRGFMSLLFRGQSGQTIKLRSEDIRSIAIPAAPMHVQAELAQELARGRDRIREAQEAIRSSSALLAERRQALITAAVTGQFDVSTASGRHVTDGVTA
ncbi:hypothetical protein [Streptomyces sp. NPDC002078]